MAGLMRQGQNPEEEMPVEGEMPAEQMPQQGLMQGAIPAEEMPPEQVALEQEPPPEQMPPDQAQQGEQPPEEEEPLVEEEDDAALQKAYAFVHDKLYAEDYAEQLAAVFADTGTAPNIVAQMTYKLSQAADTATGGEIAEENLVPLGMFTVSEIFEIAGSAGVEVSSETVSKTIKKLVLIFLEDQGIDSSEMEAAFKGVDDKEFAKFADESEGEFVDG